METHKVRMLQMTKWVEGLSESGSYTGGDPLVTNGRYVSKDNVLSDGPFIEAKECISGYIAIKAENLEQAVSFAQTCPFVLDGSMAIEVREIMIPFTPDDITEPVTK